MLNRNSSFTSFLTVRDNCDDNNNRIIKITKYVHSFYCISYLCTPIRRYSAHVIMYRGNYGDRLLCHIHSGEHPGEV